MTTALESARDTLAQLKDKLAESDRRSIDLESEARQISLAAMTGDAAARKRLDKLNGERATHELESRNVRAAIRAQEAAVVEAERAEEATRLAEGADRALALGERLVERARKIDEAFGLIAEESNAFMADITALNQIGLRNPRADQFTVLGSMAANAALMFTPLKIQHLAPKDRRTFEELASGWRDTVARWAAPFINIETAA
jgi:hypothetical protein